MNDVAARLIHGSRWLGCGLTGAWVPLCRLAVVALTLVPWADAARAEEPQPQALRAAPSAPSVALSADLGSEVPPRFKVAFFNPNSRRNHFWLEFEKVMQAAASDLNMELKVYEADDNHRAYVRKVDEVLGSDDRPDFFLFKAFKATTRHILDAAEAAGVPCLTVNAAPTTAEMIDLGKPRVVYHQWLGMVVPDDEQVGYLLAERLVDRAQARGLQRADGGVDLLALTGLPGDQASIDRLRGLNRFLAERPKIDLLQEGAADWDRAKAASWLARVGGKYRQEHVVVWSASDSMALGALDTARKSQQTILTTGVDWLPEAQEALAQGDLIASAGGHFLDGAWALVLLNDYAHGRDFQEIGTIFNSNMALLTAENIQRYRQTLGRGDYQRIDFTKFSRLHSGANSYDFSAAAVIDQLAAQGDATAAQ